MVLTVYLTVSPSLMGSVTLILYMGSKGSIGVPGVEGSDGPIDPLLPKSEVGVS